MNTSDDLPGQVLKSKLNVLRSPVSPKISRVAFLVYCGFFLYWTFTGLFSPIVNWDIVPYTACALEKRVPAEQLRIATYTDLRQFSPSHFPDRVENKYQQAVMDSDQALKAQLPFYQVKPLYVLLTRWLGDITGSYSAATVTVSALGFFFIGIAVWMLRPVNIHPVYWATLILCFNLVTVPINFTLFPSASTPDTLAGALFLGGCAFILKGGRIYLAAACWAGAVLSRPDYILSILSLTPFLWIIRAEFRQRLAIIPILGIPLLVYLLSKLLIPGYNLPTLLAHSFLGPFYDPLAPDNPMMDLAVYWEKLKLNGLWLWQAGRPAFFLLLGLAAPFFLQAKSARLALAAVLGILMKILLFPNIDGGYQERYYFTSYLLIIVACLSSCAPMVDKTLTEDR